MWVSWALVIIIIYLAARLFTGLLFPGFEMEMSLTALLLFIVGLRISAPYRRSGEKAADLWAKSILKRDYPSLQVDVVAKAAFDSIDARKSKWDRIMKPVFLIVVTLTGRPHPTDEERIEYLRDKQN